ncbi:putative protein OCTOPUS [Helianthus annuus]|nr:putative protein OCTOPUS [Helianthus annuus]
MDPDPQTRTRTRTRRRSTCHRHPNEPVTGLCALCLRDRLTGLDSATTHLQTKHETIVSFPLSRRTRGHAGGALSSTLPELRRSRSVAVEKCEILNDSCLDLRRKSCDVRVCNRLTDLFDVDDSKSGDRAVRVESKNLGFFVEDNGEISEIRASGVNDNGEIEEEEEEGDGDDLRTMKEHIEMELQNRKKKLWKTASVFGDKLRKWRKRDKEKKESEKDRSSLSRFKDPELQCGRGSCDVAPRFSVDALRMSVEDPQFSYDEHRASWDGYMIARTIPRLTPMLPIVDDMILPPVNKRVMVKEEGSSSGASAKSNSDSCSSNTASSSSSMKSSSSKGVGLEGGYVKSALRINDVIGQETKLVITEREFNDWHLRSVNDSNLESASNAPVSARRTVKNGWRKVSSLWSYKSKHSDKKNGGCIPEKGASLNQNSEIKTGKLVRNSSCVGSRNKTESHTNGLEGGRHSLSDIESGLMRLHFSAFGKSRKKLAPSMVTDD